MSTEGVANVAPGLQQLRRIRGSRAQYEHLQRPETISPGEAIPSIEGWVLFLTGLPAEATAETIADFFSGFKESDPDYFGPIKDARPLLDRDCLCAGYGLVELTSQEYFQRALQSLNGASMDGAEAPIGVFPAFLGEEDATAAEGAQEADTGDKRGRDDEEEIDGDAPEVKKALMDA